MSEELKPCPFCGGDAFVFAGMVGCDRCGASVSAWGNDEAIKAWNRRTGCDSVVARISLDEGKLRQLVGEAVKNVVAEYAQPVKDALKALEYYGERGEPMPAYVCRELADDMKAAGDD